MRGPFSMLVIEVTTSPVNIRPTNIDVDDLIVIRSDRSEFASLCVTVLDLPEACQHVNPGVNAYRFGTVLRMEPGFTWVTVLELSLVIAKRIGFLPTERFLARRSDIGESLEPETNPCYA